MTRSDIARACFRAYETGDRALIEPLLADDLAFFSPPDPGIDLATYWERCWPNAGLIDGFELVRLIEHGDEVVVTYESTKTDGSRFRNTEVLTITGGQVSRIEVYFGWTIE